MCSTCCIKHYKLLGLLVSDNFKNLLYFHTKIARVLLHPVNIETDLLSIQQVCVRRSWTMPEQVTCQKSSNEKYIYKEQK